MGPWGLVDRGQRGLAELAVELVQGQELLVECRQLLLAPFGRIGETLRTPGGLLGVERLHGLDGGGHTVDAYHQRRGHRLGRELAQPGCQVGAALELLGEGQDGAHLGVVAGGLGEVLHALVDGVDHAVVVATQAQAPGDHHQGDQYGQHQRDAGDGQDGVVLVLANSLLLGCSRLSRSLRSISNIL